MRRSDTARDSKSEPRASMKTGARSVAPGESIEEFRLSFGGDSRAVISHPDLDVAVAAVETGGDGGARRCVDPGVAQQVRQDLVEPLPITVDGDDFSGQFKLPLVIRGRRPGIGHGFKHYPSDIHFKSLQGASGIEAGQQEQISHQVRHPVGRNGDPPQRFGCHLRAATSIRAGSQLGVGPDGRQRRPQLVTGIGNESPQPPLGRVPVRQCTSHMLEHVREGGTHLVHFGGGVVRRSWHWQLGPGGRQRKLGHLEGGRREPSERVHRAPDHDRGDDGAG